MLADEELEAIREHDLAEGKLCSSGTAWHRRQLLAEVDRLRKLDGLAREWLAAADRATGKSSASFEQMERLMFDCMDAAEAYRKAVEE